METVHTWFSLIRFTVSDILNIVLIPDDFHPFFLFSITVKSSGTMNDVKIQNRHLISQDILLGMYHVAIRSKYFIIHNKFVQNILLFRMKANVRTFDKIQNYFYMYLTILQNVFCLFGKTINSLPGSFHVESFLSSKTKLKPETPPGDLLFCFLFSDCSYYWMFLWLNLREKEIRPSPLLLLFYGIIFPD